MSVSLTAGMMYMYIYTCMCVSVSICIYLERCPVRLGNVQAISLIQRVLMTLVL